MSTRSIGKMSPFVVVNFGNEDRQTPVCIEGGLNPVFDTKGNKFCFRRIDEIEMSLVLMDNMNDENLLIGEVKLNVENYVGHFNNL